MEIVASRISDIEEALPAGFKLVHPAISTALLTVFDQDVIDTAVDFDETFERLGCPRLLAGAPDGQGLMYVFKADGDRIELRAVERQYKRMICANAAFEMILAGRHSNGKQLEDAARALLHAKMNLSYFRYLTCVWQKLLPEAAPSKYINNDRIRGFISGRLVPSDIEAMTFCGFVVAVMVFVSFLRFLPQDKTSKAEAQARDILMMTSIDVSSLNVSNSVFNERGYLTLHLATKFLTNLAFWSSPTSQGVLKFFSIKDVLK